MSPSRLRKKARRTRRRMRQYGWEKFAGRPLHELRWAVSSPARRSEWAERRLALDGYYWLFLLGLNNSGTSILRRILGTHPEIRSLPDEGQLLTSAFPTAPRYGVGRTWTKRLDVFRWTEESDPAPALRARYDWAWHFSPGRGILLEKSPPDSIRSLWLERNFSPSRFLALVRHPYAVCEGIRRRARLPLEDAARHWAVGNEILLDDAERLERCLVLSYEELTERPGEQLDRIEAFLELAAPTDRAILEERIPAHNIDRRPQHIQNMNAKSIERLSPDDLETIDRIAGPLMERLGYERANAGADAGAPREAAT